MIGLSVKLIHWHFTAANFCQIKLNLTNNFEYIISSFQYQKYQHFKTIKNIKFKSKKNSNTPKQPKISRFENKWLSIDISQLQFCFCPSCLVSLSGKCHHPHHNHHNSLFTTLERLLSRKGWLRLIVQNSSPLSFYFEPETFLAPWREQDYFISHCTKDQEEHSP